MTAYRGSTAVSIDGPPQGVDEDRLWFKLGKANSLQRAAEDKKEVDLVAARSLSFGVQNPGISKWSTAAGSFWSSMFRTNRGGKLGQALHCPSF